MNEDREFSENIDRLLAGQDVAAGEDMSEDYRTAIQFAHKLKDQRDEAVPAFKDRLRRRLLSQIATPDAAAERRSQRTAFWEVLGRLVPRSPVGRTAIVTVAVAILAAIVFWQSGLFLPAQAPTREGEPVPALAPTPKVTPKEPAAVTRDTADNLKLEPAVSETGTYQPGEEISIELVFRNTGAEVIVLTPFPPAIRIDLADTGTAVRSFPPGSESVAIPASSTFYYTLVWNQRDDGGQQVMPGRYTVTVGDISPHKEQAPPEFLAGRTPVMELVITVR